MSESGDVPPPVDPWALALGDLAGVAQAIVLVLDLEGRIVRFNPYLAKLSGWRLEEVEGEDWFTTFLPERDRERMRALCTGVLEAGQVDSSVSPIVTRGGEERYVEWSSSRLAGLEGRSLGVLSIGLDVTRRVLAEAHRERKKIRLESVLDTLTDGVFVLDAREAICALNAAAERIFGYDFEELEGQDVARLLVKPKTAEHDAQGQGSLPRGEATFAWGEREVIGLRKDGSAFPMWLRVGELGEGQERGFTWVVRDLSGPKRAKTELRQREAEVERLQRLEAVGRFSGGLAHEYRNLLMGIQGCTNMALEEIRACCPASSPSPCGARAHVEEIFAAAQRGGSLATRLLEFARPSEEAALESAALDAAIEETESLLRGLLRDDIALVVSKGAPGISVRVGAGSIQQTLLNLALNAQDAMPEGGSLSIETRLAESEALTAVLVVRDTGTGMDSATQARIFEPFFTTKTARIGTGLGLSTIHGLVKRAGGRVAVESTLGEGTTFRLTFPACADTAGPGALSEGEARAVNTPPATVLVVEDERLVLLTVSHYLQRAGHRALQARRPSEALELCHSHPGAIDLILTDVSLPEMGGGELVRRLHAQRPNARVLFMSAHSRRQLLREGRVSADAETIEKPFDEATLAGRIAAILSG